MVSGNFELSPIQEEELQAKIIKVNYAGRRTREMDGLANTASVSLYQLFSDTPTLNDKIFSSPQEKLEYLQLMWNSIKLNVAKTYEPVKFSTIFDYPNKRLDAVLNELAWNCEIIPRTKRLSGRDIEVTIEDVDVENAVDRDALENFVGDAVEFLNSIYITNPQTGNKSIFAGYKLKSDKLGGLKQLLDRFDALLSFQLSRKASAAQLDEVNKIKAILRGPLAEVYLRCSQRPLAQREIVEASKYEIGRLNASFARIWMLLDDGLVQNAKETFVATGSEALKNGDHGMNDIPYQRSFVFAAALRNLAESDMTRINDFLGLRIGSTDSKCMEWSLKTSLRENLGVRVGSNGRTPSVITVPVRDHTETLRIFTNMAKQQHTANSISDPTYNARDLDLTSPASVCNLLDGNDQKMMYLNALFTVTPPDKATEIFAAFSNISGELAFNQHYLFKQILHCERSAKILIDRVDGHPLPINCLGGPIPNEPNEIFKIAVYHLHMAKTLLQSLWECVFPEKGNSLSFGSLGVRISLAHAACLHHLADHEDALLHSDSVIEQCRLIACTRSEGNSEYRSPPIDHEVSSQIAVSVLDYLRTLTGFPNLSQDQICLIAGGIGDVLLENVKSAKELLDSDPLIEAVLVFKQYMELVGRLPFWDHEIDEMRLLRSEMSENFRPRYGFDEKASASLEELREVFDRENMMPHHEYLVIPKDLEAILNQPLVDASNDVMRVVESAYDSYIRVYTGYVEAGWLFEE